MAAVVARLERAGAELIEFEVGGLAARLRGERGFVLGGVDC